MVPPPLPGRSSLRVLIADDEKSFRDALEDLLVQEGMRVGLARDGLEAIRSLEQRPYDIVLADLKMPGADGLQVLQASKRLQPDALVIIITGYGSMETALEAVRLGAYDYIAKPFAFEELLVVIHNAGERIRLVEENRRLAGHIREMAEDLRSLRTTRGPAGDTYGARRPGAPRALEVPAGSSLPPHPLEQFQALGLLGREVEVDEVEGLESLRRLRDAAILSEAEFTEVKQRLLRRLLRGKS